MNTINTLHEVTASQSPDESVKATREPVWRVVGGSIATGLVGALALTLGVFAGASEYVITASALLAFACGWAMLAILSARYTSQPQRWARVPAAAMAIVALVLLVTSPGDQALTAAGWAWPPAMLALTIWMIIQLRRDLHGRVRWLVYPVLGALVVGSIGGAFETVSRVSDRHDFAAPGTLYDVGGHRLHLDCVGSGSPTVVLENGLGGLSVLWSRITAEASRTTRVCAYDRAGQGWSDDVSAPQDGVAVAADLHTLLQRAGEAGPYVLVGHSAGGAYAMVYAARYPNEVAGMVLLDSMSPYQFTALPDFASQYSMMRRGLAVLPSFARMGLVRIMPSSAASDFPEPAAAQVRAFGASPRQYRSMRDEQSVYPAVLRQAQALLTLHDKPLVVITATGSQRDTKGWTAAQDQMAQLSTNSQHRIVEATHDGVVDDVHSFEKSVQAIDDVVKAIRTTSAVAAR